MYFRTSILIKKQSTTSSLKYSCFHCNIASNDNINFSFLILKREVQSEINHEESISSNHSSSVFHLQSIVEDESRFVYQSSSMTRLIEHVCWSVLREFLLTDFSSFFFFFFISSSIASLLVLFSLFQMNNLWSINLTSQHSFLSDHIIRQTHFLLQFVNNNSNFQRLFSYLWQVINFYETYYDFSNTSVRKTSFRRIELWVRSSSTLSSKSW
jgi:hypothetical protein